MGLDGGTVISRSDVLRGASWRVASSDAHQRSTRGGQVSQSYVAQREAASAADVAAAKWTSCALTGEPLRDPIVADGLGKLYNKESVVQLLLARNGVFPDDAARYRYENQLHFLSDLEHLRSLKDVFTLHPTYEDSEAQNSGAREPTSSAGPQGDQRKSAKSGVTIGMRWVCPITSMPAGGSHQFSALRPCGHCFSSRALREVADTQCPLCGTKYRPHEAVLLHPSEQQMQEQRARLKKRLHAATADKDRLETRKVKRQRQPSQSAETSEAPSTAAAGGSHAPSHSLSCGGI